MVMDVWVGCMDASLIRGGGVGGGWGGVMGTHRGTDVCGQPCGSCGEDGGLGEGGT